MQIADLRARLMKGLVIPAHPMALTSESRLSEKRQRALSRYYLAAGAGGLAVGVHTTQFAIHNETVGLLKPVLELAAEEARSFQKKTGRTAVLVAGVVGKTRQAVQEVELARELGYHCALVSLGGLTDLSDQALLEHLEAVSERLPVFGFYLQPAVGGRHLDYRFWRGFAGIENVAGIKIAPFNRYETIDVARAVAASGRGAEIALYTGNDDSIFWDLLTPFTFRSPEGETTLRIRGGLLGQWAVWTKSAVAHLQEIHSAIGNSRIPVELAARGARLTSANAAIFDAGNDFRGCVPGIHEVLRRQGLLEGVWCLDPRETLSPGQAEEIERACTEFPELTDDNFVAEHLDEWLNG